MHVRLHGEDAAWLRMDDATNPMVVSGLLELEDVLPEERVDELVHRLLAFPPFAARIAEPALRIGVPWWRPLGRVDLEEHIEHVRLETSTDAELRAFVGRTVSQALDPARPLWRLYLIDRPGSGTMLLFRVHHAIADGYALLGLLHALSDTNAVLPRRPGTAVPPAPWDYLRRLAKGAEELLRSPTEPMTMLRGPLRGEKHVAWSKPIALSTIKRMGAASSATVNDVLAATVAGALRRYLSRRGEPCDALELHAMVPVDLRAPGSELDLANRFGLVILGLPVGIVDPIARIGAVRQRMQRLKESAEAKVAQMVLGLLGYAPRPIEDAVVRYFGGKASLVFTNLIGPREHAKLGGISIRRMMFWVPEAAHLGLGISVFSYAGEITVCVLSDGAMIEDPEMLVAEFEAELASAAALGVS